MTFGIWNFEDFPVRPPWCPCFILLFFAAKNLEEEEHLKVSAREMRR
jgi:hypothetical protein